MKICHAEVTVFGLLLVQPDILSGTECLDKSMRTHFSINLDQKSRVGFEEKDARGQCLLWKKNGKER